MRPIRFIALSDSLPQKRNLPLPKLKILTPKFPLEQWKNEIDYNSAYVQTETFNFNFAWQAVIVYIYLCFNFKEIAMPNINVKAIIFANNFGL